MVLGSAALLLPLAEPVRQHPSAGHPARPHRGGAHPSPRSGTRPLAARVLARCLLLCTLLAPGLAQAQDVTLIGNTGAASSGGSTNLGQRSYAQQFSTGDNLGGYVVNAIDLGFGNLTAISGDNIPRVSIVEVASNGDPSGTTVGTFTRPDSISSNRLSTYTTSTGISLDPGTDYFVLIEGRNSTFSRIATAANTQTGVAGWSLGSRWQRAGRTSGDWTEVTGGTRPHVRIALKGTVPDLPPTITSIERQAPMREETVADRLTWRVTFSEPVQNRARRVFNWAVSGPTGTTITQTDVGGTDYQTVLIAGSGETYIARESDVWDVTVSGGNLASYTGDIALTLTGAAQELTGVQDTANQALTNATPTGTNDNSYTRVKNRIESIERLSFGGAQNVTTDAEFTNLTWRVTFTNPVQAIRRETLRDSWTITGPDSVTIEQTRVSDEVWEVTVSGRDLETHAGDVTLGLNVSPSPPQLFVQGGQLINATPLGVNENTYTLTRAPVPVAGVRLLRCDGAGEPAGCYDGQPVAEDAGTLDLTVVIDLPRSWTEDPDFAPSEVSGDVNGIRIRSLGAGATPDATATAGADFEAVDVRMVLFPTDIVDGSFLIEVPVTLLDDTVEEGEERFFLTFTELAGLSGLNFKGQQFTLASLTRPLTAPEDAIVIFDGDAGETSTAPEEPVVSSGPMALPIWEATLNVQDADLFKGCINTTDAKCSSLLDDDDFVIDGTTYVIDTFYTSAVGNLVIVKFSPALPDTFDETTLTLTIDGAVPTVDLSSNRNSFNNLASNQLAPGWMTGQMVDLQLLQSGLTDTTAPTVSITGVPDVSTGPFTATITFSEPVAGFTLDDITVENATLSEFGTVTDPANTIWTVLVTPTGGGNGIVALFIPSSAATDAAGNSISGPLQDRSVNSAYMPMAPTVTSITRQSPMAELTNADELTWRVEFSEPVGSVDAADFVLTGTTATLLVAPFFERVYDLTATGGNLATLDGPVTLGFATGQDISGVSTSLPLSDTAPTTGTNENSYTLDNTGPRVNAFTRFAPTVSPTNADTLTWRVSFSEPVEKLDVTDFLLMGTTATLAAPVPAGDVPNAWDITASGGDLASLNATVILGAGGGLDIADAAGNALTSAMPVPNEDRYVVDNTAPRTVSILRQDPMTQLTNADQLTWRVTFSEAVREVAAADFTSPAGVMRTVVPVAPGTALGSVAWDVRFSDDPAVSGDPLASANGDVSINYDQRAVSIEDLAGNVMSDTSPTGTAEPTYTLNNTAPVVSIEAGADVDKGTAAVFTLRRTGATTAALTVMVSVTQTGSVIDTTALPTSVTFGANEATATLSVATMDDGMADSVGTVIVEIEEPDPVRYVPADPPRAAVAVTGRPAVEISDVPATSTGPFTAVIGFSKPVSGFTVADITATNATLSGFAADSTAGTTPDTVWTVLVTPTADGAVALDIAADVATDTAGNGNLAAPQATSTYDGTDPTVVSIVRWDPTSSPTDNDTLAWRVEFSEPVANIDADDFAVSGTTAALSVVTRPAFGPNIYLVVAEDGDLADFTGPVTLSFAPTQNITDAPGRSLTDTAPTSGTNDNTYTVDNTAPGVASIVRHAPTAELTDTDALTWRVRFDEAVVNMDAADIQAGGTTAPVSDVQPVPGETGLYEVTVSGGDLAELNGTVTLGFATDASIADHAGNALTDTMPTGQNQSYNVDNTAPLVSITVDAAPVNEGGVALFTLSRTGPRTSSLAVTVSITQTGQVLDGAPRSEDVVFQVGSAMATINVATTNDDVDEADGVITATVTANSTTPATYQVGSPSSATITINDDDTRGVVVTGSPLTINEGGNGNYTVVLTSEPTGGDVSITPSSNNPEVTFTPATLTFTAANWNTPQPVTVMTQRDPDDVNATATITHTVAGADYGNVTAESVDVTVSEIVLPRITIAPAAPSVIEGTAAAFTLTRNGGDITTPLTVNVTVTPTGDVLSTPTPSTVTFAADSATTRLSISTEDDTVDENAGMVTVTVEADSAAPATYVLGTGTHAATVTVEDNDASPVVMLSLSESAIAEAGGVSEVRATLNNPSAEDTQVTVSIPAEVIDAVRLGGDPVLLIPAGATTSDNAVTLTSVDNPVEASEDLQVTVSGMAENTLGVTQPEPVTLTILDDDDNTAPTVTITDVPATSGGPFTATIIFDEPVSGFMVGDIMAANANLSDFIEATTEGATTGEATPGTVYTVLVTPTVDGDVTLNVAANVATDAAGNGNTASPQATSTYTAPHVTAIERQAPTTSPTNADRLTWRVTFSEVVTNVDAADFTVSGTTATLSVAPVAGQPAAWDVTISGGDLATLNSTVTLDLASGHNIVGAGGGALATTPPTGTNDNVYVVDHTAPTVNYPVPTSLVVGMAITPITITPTTEDTDIARWSATGLPAGLVIDELTGVISGTPTTVSAAPSQVSVTVTDRSGNSTTVRLNFPAVTAQATRTAQQEAEVVLKEVVLPNLVQQLTAETTEVITSRLNTIASGSPGTPPSLSLEDMVADTVAALYGQREHLNNGSLDWRQALSGRNFALPLSSLDVAQGESADAQEEHPFSTLAIWGGGNYSSYRNIIENTDVDGNGFSAAIGMDLQPTPQLTTGLALTTSRWGLDYATTTNDATGDSAEGTYEIGVTMVHPYVNWSATEHLSLWVTLGYGRGEVEQDPEDGKATTRSDGLTSWAGGVRFEVVPGMDPRTGQGAPFGLAIKADGATSSFLETSVQLARLAAEVSRAFAVENGLLTTALELGWRIRSVSGKDDPDGQQQAIAEKNDGGDAELAGHLHWRNTDGSVSATVEPRVVLGGGHHREWGIGGHLRLAPSRQAGEGLSLTLQPSFGVTGTRLEELWSLSGDGDLAVNNDPPGARLDARLAYGFPLGDAILTPYTEVTWAETANTYGAGLRYGLTPSPLELDLKGTRRSGTNGKTEHRFSLDVRSDL